MDDYVKIEKEDYHRIPVGTFIKWKKKDGEISIGGTINAITTKTASSYAWVVTVFKKKIIISWDTEIVYIIKPLFYDSLNSKIENLTNLLNFFAEQVNEKMAEIYTHIDVDEPEDDLYSEYGAARVKYETGSLRESKMKREQLIRRRGLKKITKKRNKKRDVVINFKN